MRSLGWNIEGAKDFSITPSEYEKTIIKRANEEIKKLDNSLRREEEIIQSKYDYQHISQTSYYWRYKAGHMPHSHKLEELTRWEKGRTRLITYFILVIVAIVLPIISLILDCSWECSCDILSCDRNGSDGFTPHISKLHPFLESIINRAESIPGEEPFAFLKELGLYYLFYALITSVPLLIIPTIPFCGYILYCFVILGSKTIRCVYEKSVQYSKINYWDNKIHILNQQIETELEDFKKKNAILREQIEQEKYNTIIQYQTDYNKFMKNKNEAHQREIKRKIEEYRRRIREKNVSIRRKHTDSKEKYKSLLSQQEMGIIAWLCGEMILYLEKYAEEKRNNLFMRRASYSFTAEQTSSGVSLETKGTNVPSFHNYRKNYLYFSANEQVMPTSDRFDKWGYCCAIIELTISSLNKYLIANSLEGGFILSTERNLYDGSFSIIYDSVNNNEPVIVSIEESELLDEEAEIDPEKVDVLLTELII